MDDHHRAEDSSLQAFQAQLGYTATNQTGDLDALPILRNLARPVMRRLAGLDRRLYFWQAGRFIRDDAVRRELLPQYYARFRAARPAFW